MYASLSNVWGLGLLGLVTGILGALLGTGGGVFLIPFLVIMVGVPMHHAIATSILAVIATSSAAAITNVERGTVNIPLGMTLESATVLGAISGGVVAGWIPGATLELLFAISLLPTAIVMWRRPKVWAENGMSGRTPQGSLLAGSYFDDSTLREVTYDVQRLWAGLLVSFVAGNLSGLLGIGGGVFKVPALHLLCHVPMKAAAATSNFMIGVTASTTAFFYFGRGEVRPALSAVIVLGVLAGSILGTHLTRWLKSHHLRRAFACLLILLSLQMLLRSLGTR